MTTRELGTSELFKRVKPFINTGLIKKVFEYPDRQVDASDMPCVIVMQGEDKIVKRSTRNYLGYPCGRELIIVVECWDHSSGSVSTIRDTILEAILQNSGILIPKVLIREQKQIGPFNLGVPKVLGIRMYFEMNYTDDGF